MKTQRRFHYFVRRAIAAQRTGKLVNRFLWHCYWIYQIGRVELHLHPFWWEWRPALFRRDIIIIPLLIISLWIKR